MSSLSEIGKQMANQNIKFDADDSIKAIKERFDNIDVNIFQLSINITTIVPSIEMIEKLP